LSLETGTLDVSRFIDEDEISLTWKERGGPSVAAPSGAGGYGSKLVNLSVSSQLGVTITYDRSADCVTVVLKLRGDKLAQ
jgi:two-component sensor histidine kinase